MKVTIIYSNPYNVKSADSLYAQASDAYHERHELVGNFNLADYSLQYCIGCWFCWWKTPGECVLRDDIGRIFKSIMQSDLLVYIAPLKMGTVPAELKKFVERMIPLIHPYMAVVDGEIHHSRRYEKYPDIAAVLVEEKDTDDEDRAINAGWYDRLVKNFYSRVRFIKFVNTVNAEGSFEIPVD